MQTGPSEETGMLSMEQQAMDCEEGPRETVEQLLAGQKLDEGSRERWERIAGFLAGIFDVGREVKSWYDAKTFVSYYTYCPGPGRAASSGGVGLCTSFAR
jgi:hypothetical protein